MGFLQFHIILILKDKTMEFRIRCIMLILGNLKKYFYEK